MKIREVREKFEGSPAWPYKEAEIIVLARRCSSVEEIKKMALEKDGIYLQEVVEVQRQIEEQDPEAAVEQQRLIAEQENRPEIAEENSELKIEEPDLDRRIENRAEE